MSTQTTHTLKLDYPCQTCDDTFKSKQAVVDHHKAAHNTKISKAQVRQVKLSKEQFNSLLESIYAINKYAKKYSGESQECYERGDKPLAKKNSLRKDALYELKAELLRLIYQNGCYDDLEKHRVDNDIYWLMRVDNWEFHSPEDALDPDEEDIGFGKDEPVDLCGFNSGREQNHSDKCLKSALLDIQRITGISANEYLPQDKVRISIEKEYIGWEYLPKSGR